MLYKMLLFFIFVAAFIFTLWFLSLPTKNSPISFPDCKPIILKEVVKLT